MEAMAVDRQHPLQLGYYYQTWLNSPTLMRNSEPTLVFAVFGQAKIDGNMRPEEESHSLDTMLRYWASRNALNIPGACAALNRSQIAAKVA